MSSRQKRALRGSPWQHLRMLRLRLDLLLARAMLLQRQTAEASWTLRRRNELRLTPVRLQRHDRQPAHRIFERHPNRLRSNSRQDLLLGHRRSELGRNPQPRDQPQLRGAALVADLPLLPLHREHRLVGPTPTALSERKRLPLVNQWAGYLLCNRLLDRTR